MARGRTTADRNQERWPSVMETLPGWTCAMFAAYITAVLTLISVVLL